MKSEKCTIEMMPERRRDMGDSVAMFQQEWAEGEPKKEGITEWFTGKGKSHSVITYACPECGVLKSFLSEKLKEE